MLINRPCFANFIRIRRQVSFSLRRFLPPLLALALANGCHRADRTNEKALRREVRLALRDRSYTQAAGLAQRLTASSAQDDKAWESLFRAQLGLHDFASARRTLEQWRDAMRKPSARLEERSGDLAAREQNAPLAFAAWSRALEVKPSNLRLLRKIAEAHRTRQEWPEEDAAWSALLAQEDSGVARIERARCRRRMHRWPEALEDCRRAQELSPDDPDVHRGARLFERLGKFLPQIRELDARLALTPDDDQLLADRALLFLRSDDAELALPDAEAAAARSPGAIRPRLFRALSFIAQGRGAECAAMKIDPHLRLFQFSPEFLETIARLDAGISLEPNNPELHLARAWQLNEIGQPALALQDAQDSLGADGALAQAQAESSYALAKLGQTAEALTQIKRATELDPASAITWRYRGELEMKQKDFAAAIESLTHSLTLEQTSAALQKRELCYIQTAQYQKAEADHRALETLR